MAKKETLNPLTAFRKANEARKAVVMKSLKKAQEGIVQDTSAAQTLYKNTKPWEGKANFDTLDPADILNTKNKKAAEENKNKLDVLNAIYPGYQTPYQKKTGGISKSKKR